MGRAVCGIAEAFQAISPDVTLLLGDRYETFAGGLAAAALRLPIAHIGGGECDHATCLDGYLRNALTQLAHLHFVSCEAYAERLMALGQDAWRIHVVGLPSLDGIADGLMTRQELSESLGVSLAGPVIAGTYLPVTLRPEQSKAELRGMLAALEEHPDATVILTLSNADAGGTWVDASIRTFASERPNAHAFDSLGRRRYLSLLSIADAVIGNSSSGVIETPSFAAPTVNIGDRQNGRLRADNVIDAPGETVAIREALDRALHDSAFRARAAAAVNPFGDGHAGERIAAVLSDLAIDRCLMEKRLPAADGSPSGPTWTDLAQEAARC
jgi:UDP-hydrolysing UDP-N-acetyl-D-glucosamine 2-epimerase